MVLVVGNYGNASPARGDLRAAFGDINRDGEVDVAITTYGGMIPWPYRRAREEARSGRKFRCRLVSFRTQSS